MSEDLLILGELIAEQAAHMDAATHRILSNIRDFDSRGGWASARSCAHWLSWRVGWTLGTAREHVRVAKTLGTLPGIDEALRLGKLSYCKVRAMTRVATPENERVLLMDAQLTTGSQLEKVCRKYKQLKRYADGASPASDAEARYVTRRDLDSGMVRIEAVLHPEEAALVWAAIDRATKELLRDRHQETRSVPERSADTETANRRTDVSAETGGGFRTTAEDATPMAHVYAETEDAPGSTTHEAEPCGHVSAETEEDALRFARHAPDACGHVSAETGAAEEHCHDVSAETGGDFTSMSEDATEWAHVSAETGDEMESAGGDDEPWDDVPAEPQTHLDSTHRDPRPPALAGASPKPARRRPQFDRADGLVALARRFACGESSRTPVEIVVTVSSAALQGTAPGEECVATLDDGGSIIAESARRLACDAGVVHMAEDEHGNPLSVGRRTRSIPSAIWRALLKRDKCCRFPGCTNRLYVEGHHIEHWANGGETKLSNMALLCGHHHRFVHEYGYRIDIDSHGQLSFFDPRGRPVKDVPDRIERPDLGWPQITAANRELDIEPHSCGWNGEPVQYAEVCRALYLVDEGIVSPDDLC